ncbi:MAG: iron ABC transporter permease [Candidatus Verstraetearchaeota archaeon]|nr:iron ABC transporter permease [Candidatus Verstraetearchaeota archaeon]
MQIGVKKLRLALYLASVSIFFCASFIASIMMGSLQLSPWEVIDSIISPWKDPVASSIVLGYRVPRVLFASLTGFVLGVSGGVIQTLTRNPLADPYITGMSSGAALGAAIAFVMPSLPYLAVPASAFVGGVSMLVLSIFLAKKAGAGSMGFILAGIAVGTFASAMLMVVLSIASEKAHGIIYWLFGSFSTSTWMDLQVASAVSIPAVAFALYKARDLNILLLGEEHAAQLGLDSRRLWLLMLIASSLSVSVCVSFCGIIGFIGLVAPHMVRLIIGSDNRFVLPLAGFTGSLLIVIADDIVRNPLNPIAEMPVGSITSMIGVPFFVYLLIRKGKSFGM